MFHVVHINTKWCALRDSEKTKAMFLIAVARPQWDRKRQQLFDGKLGVWTFIVADPSIESYFEINMVPWNEAALHGGRHLRVLETITRKDIQTMVTSNVIPAIKAKMPSSLRNEPLYIQLDNQQMRLMPHDPVIAEYGKTDGWDIQVQYQPAYSPELVVLHHDFLKILTPEMTSRSISMRLAPLIELIASVERAFAAVTKRQINDAFLALQKMMECIMVSGGSNDLISNEDATKKSLQHDGSLPVSILCKQEALLACQSALNNFNQAKLASNY
ncbi:uncharacterized protein CCR75_008044 [Bremia lactucae]|uniref:Uncharacterized protein n=1 Tax=Bremia lactucae TaxID=4779 RepID=A0A976P016_BRELC|nr:hypothetical protein CCR75_008044 [Bremia lactucae]